MLTALHLTSLQWIQSALGCHTGLLIINHSSEQSKGFQSSLCSSTQCIFYIIRYFKPQFFYFGGNLELLESVEGFIVFFKRKQITISFFCLKSWMSHCRTRPFIFSGCEACCSAPFLGICHRGDVKVLPPCQSQERQQHIPLDQIHAQNYTSWLFMMR